jgi:hypothetical protein
MQTSQLAEIVRDDLHPQLQPRTQLYMPTITQLLKSRTLWFAVILAALSVAQGYVGLLPLTPMQQMYVGIGISVIVTVLRIVTTQPLSDK